MKPVYLIVLITILAACGSDGVTPIDDTTLTASYSGDPIHGERLYLETCIACHGPGGEGVENLGKPFTTSDFIRGKTDQSLQAFIEEGRAADDPDNTTGIAMLPKGGNPTLSDDDILDIIAYIRTLQH
ncbi:MAG: mono/diheme cytochrome c family protein [Cellvibrionaceae bacterium]|jgi:mono/diheme cytochrome c family protein